ncbi:MAG TPA: hypothetical protein VHY83_01515 [Solirubrobacteraceae bacterium]|jgi:hypothetical protein|nr:hypothetical protein [Solirubrobacteraceae bacterium]
MSLAGSLVGLGARGATLPLRATVVALDAGLAVERRTRAALTATAGRLSLDALDALFASDAIDRVLERVETAGVAQHVAQRMLEGGIAEQIVTGVLQGPELEEIITSALDSEQARDGVARMLESEASERLLDRLISSPAGERLVAQVLASPLMEETVTGLLESEELWVLVDEIARSPAVTEAITTQSASFAGQVTDRVRGSSRDADAWVERAARRMLRRRKADAGPSAAGRDGRPTGGGGTAPPPLDPGSLDR